MLAHRESDELARGLFARVYGQQGIEPGQRIVRSVDRRVSQEVKPMPQIRMEAAVCSVPPASTKIPRMHRFVSSAEGSSPPAAPTAEAGRP